jgi:hypothetical protein
VTRDEWIAGFARELGVEPPSPDQIDQLLRLAATAAHATERTAAPVSCWIAGRAGVSAAEFQAAAERVNQG